MTRTTRDLLAAGIAGYLLGERHRRRRHHPLRHVALLVVALLVALTFAMELLIAYWRFAAVAVLVMVLVAIWRHHRRSKQPTWPTSPPPWGTPQRALPPTRYTQNDLDSAFAKGVNHGQQEMRRVERSWGRSVPAFDPEDEDSF